MNKLVGQWDLDVSDQLIACQNRALKSRLMQYSDHPFVKKYGLRLNMTRRELLAACPSFSAEETQAVFHDPMFQKSWVTKGEIDIFALSSGTTAAKRKIYPITSEYLESFAHLRLLMPEISQAFGRDPSHLMRPVLTVTAQRGNDFHIDKPVMPMTWYMSFGKDAKAPENGPILHYSLIFEPDFTVKKDISLSYLRSLDVGSIGAMPPYVLAMFESLKQRFQIESFVDIWPNMSLYRLFGFSRYPYLQRLKSALGENSSIFELYAASEGIFAGQRSPHSDALQIFPNDVVYAFYDGDSQELLLPEDTDVGKVYSLEVSSPAGCFRYRMGDSVRIVSKSPFQFLFAERTDESLRIGTEIMSLSDFSSWVAELRVRLGTQIGAFLVAPNQDKSGHSLVLEIDHNLQENKAESLANSLDDLMKRDNSYYRNQRNSGFMKKPEVHLTSLGSIDRALIRPDSIGQGKYKRVWSDRTALEKVIQDSSG